MEVWTKLRCTGPGAIPREFGKMWLDAARYKDVRTMKKLLKNKENQLALLRYDGMGITYGFIGNTALHWASANNDVDMMQMLLDISTCTVNQQNRGGSTPLHSACANASVDAVAVLLKHGVNPALQDCCNDIAEDVIHSTEARRVLLPMLRGYDLACQLKQKSPEMWSVSEMRALVSASGCPRDVSEAFVEKSDLRVYVQGLLSQIKEAGEVVSGDEPSEHHQKNEENDDGFDSLKAQADAAKTKGNELYQSGDYKGAVRMYTLALRIVPNDEIYLSNRSACYLKIGLYERALEDCEKVIVLRPDWDKAQFRLQTA
eukprot:PhM_4_TR13297/c0_g1_i2/m.92183